MVGRRIYRVDDCEKCKEIFTDHYQPHEPLSYYDLLEKKTMKQQEMLMHKYAVDGMCFYHYYLKRQKDFREASREFIKMERCRHAILFLLGKRIMEKIME